MKDADLLSETALVVTTNKEWGFYGMINRVLKNDELTAEVFNAVGMHLASPQLVNMTPPKSQPA